MAGRLHEVDTRRCRNAIAGKDVYDTVENLVADVVEIRTDPWREKMGSGVVRVPLHCRRRLRDAPVSTLARCVPLEGMRRVIAEIEAQVELPPARGQSISEHLSGHLA